MSKENVSKIFLLPGIELKEELKTKFNSFGFINTYLTVNPLTYPYEVLYLMFKPEKIDLDFMMFIDSLSSNKNFIETLDLSGGKILLVYRIPKKFKRDYDLFLEGKYSRMSKEFRACFAMEKLKLDSKGKPIREGNKYAKEPTNFYHIFHRSDFMIDLVQQKYGLDDDMMYDLELYEKQDFVKESLDYAGELW
jgi:hypothetical protein